MTVGWNNHSVVIINITLVAQTMYCFTRKLTLLDVVDDVVVCCWPAVVSLSELSKTLKGSGKTWWMTWVCQWTAEHCCFGTLGFPVHETGSETNIYSHLDVYWNSTSHHVHLSIHVPNQQCCQKGPHIFSSDQ